MVNTAVANSGTYSTNDTAAILTLSSQGKAMEAATYDASKSSILKMGSKGAAVKSLQKNLTKLGYNTNGTTGYFGSDTKNAVIAFQKAYGLTPDGIVGSNTQKAINNVLSCHNKGMLVRGSKGSNVSTLQSNLKTLGYYNGKIDGTFGSETKKAVEAFQQARGLAQDGIVGTDTKKAITNVSKLQNNLKTLGYYNGNVDGVFGSATKKAVEAFQQAYNLTANGVVDSNTQKAITKAMSNHTKGILTVGSRGEKVRQLQENLKKLGYKINKVDGIFGTSTKNAVIAFQKANKLNANGIADSKTKNAISNAIDNLKKPSTKPTSSKSKIPQFQGHDDLGYLSALFETPEGCGYISSGDGDKGGKSYGLYQFASADDVPLSFIKWLKNKNSSIYTTLKTAYDTDYKKAVEMVMVRILMLHG